MFRTEEKTAHIDKLSDFVDTTGEKRVGLAVKLSLSYGPEALDMFDPHLRTALYRAPDLISAQKGEPAAWVRRFAAIERITWDREVTGAVVVITREDLLGETFVRLADCTIDRFVFELMESSVEIRCRVKAHPDNDGVGLLYESRTSTIIVSITPPEAATYEKPKDPAQPGLLPGSDDDLGDTDPDRIPVTAGGKPVRSAKGSKGAKVTKLAPAKKPGKDGVRRKPPKRITAFQTPTMDGTGERDPFERVDPKGPMQ